VNEIKSQTGKNIWLYGGSGIITTFINFGLVDSFLLAVYPVVLGEGKPLFSNIKRRVELLLNKSIPSKSGVLLMDYDVKEKVIS
jgi:dihydrofolate reductase